MPENTPTPGKTQDTVWSGIVAEAITAALSAGVSPASVIESVLAGGLDPAAFGKQLTMVVERGDKPDEITLLIADTEIIPGVEHYINPDSEWSPQTWRQNVAAGLQGTSGRVRQVLIDAYANAGAAGFFPEGDYLPEGCETTR